MLDFSTALNYIKGVGPGRATMFEAKGLRTVEDLLSYFPFRYEDRSNMKTIAQLAPGEMATVIAEVRSAKLAGFRRKDLGLFEASFTDSSRATLLGKWFHGKYLAGAIVPGQKVALFGKVEYDTYSGELSMLHPEHEILSGEDDDGSAGLHVGRIVPIYEAVAKISTKVLRTLIHNTLGTLAPVEDEIPPRIRERLRLPDRWTAIRDAHFPCEGADLRLLNSFRSPAHFRLIFEEFFWLECGLALKRNKARSMPGIAFELSDRVRERVKAMLPFKPTGAQKRVLGEIAQDMAAPRPMNRLLQGDVGSGKTIVAAEAGVIAVENGYQVAVLAPTEILANQHYIYLKQLFAKLGYAVALFTGAFTGREKTQLKKLLAEGLVHVAVGTHALLEKDVEFKRLGLSIIDEQHRFGVMQRFELSRKGIRPDVLVMTATPIPRTAAMLIYGDLDKSELREMPPGRTPIETTLVGPSPLDEAVAWERLRAEVAAGHQAYVVCPLVEDKGKVEAKAATAEYERLQAEELEGLRVGLLHGQLPSKEKEAVMAAFRAGDLDALVATTVIEVGVDVPNATVMIVENADRFGLSQLHQLRGRVGRGADQSYCFLFADPTTPDGEERMEAMAGSTDGFDLAEKDLEIRGAGEVFGERQSGFSDLKLGRIPRDEPIVVETRRVAEDILDDDPDLADHAQLREEVEDLLGDDVEFLFKS
jgi:ATP-dependent DNA helicase RecG